MVSREAILFSSSTNSLKYCPLVCITAPQPFLINLPDFILFKKYCIENSSPPHKPMTSWKHSWCLGLPTFFSEFQNYFWHLTHQIQRCLFYLLIPVWILIEFHRKITENEASHEFLAKNRANPHKLSDRSREMSVKFLQKSPESKLCTWSNLEKKLKILKLWISFVTWPLFEAQKAPICCLKCHHVDRLVFHKSSH